jgi:hypothetical protein
LPWVAQKKFFIRDKEKKAAGASKKYDRTELVTNNPLSHQADLEDYEQFGEYKRRILFGAFLYSANEPKSHNMFPFPPDDYLEMIVQFGYVTLFASAFPLAALIAVGANLIEYRADCWKLTRLCKRPCPRRQDSIGMWKRILRVMMWMSALTNCLIFAFTSSQLRQWLPNNYSTDEYGRTVLVPHTADETVFLVFAIEHVILFLGVLVRHFVDPVPEDVLDQVDRGKWLQQTYAQKARLRMMKSFKKELHDVTTNTKLQTKRNKLSKIGESPNTQ